MLLVYFRNMEVRFCLSAGKMFEVTALFFICTNFLGLNIYFYFIFIYIFKFLFF